MSAIVQEISNNKVKVSLKEDGAVILTIKRPKTLTEERFMTLSARLDKILDEFGAFTKVN